MYDLTYRRSGNSPNFNFSVKTRATDVAHVYLYIGAVEAAHLTHQSTSYTMYTTIRTAGTYLVRVEVRDTSGNVGTASMTVVRR